MNFRTVAEVFTTIEQTSSRLTITHLLADLFKKASPTQAALISYMSLGELNPPYIGTHFNVAQKSMIVIIAKLSDQPESTITQLTKKQGDISLVAFELLKKHHATTSLSINEVSARLHAIHDISGTGSWEHKEESICALLRELDPLSMKYVVRIILGKLRLGFSDMTLIDSFSWMESANKSLRKNLENAYNICADIGLIISTLKERGIAGIISMNIHCGIPIRPAGAERLESAQAIVAKLGACVAEPKLDGFRLQLHVEKKNGQTVVHFFSRNLIDMSPMFPELTHAATQLGATSLIAEGEAIAFDVDSGNFLPFQETVTRKRKHGIENAASNVPLKLFLFDILYLNGASLLTMPQEERRNKLLSLTATLSSATHNAVEVIDEVVITTSTELENYFNAQIAAGLEGILVKRPSSIYEAGKRNFNWIKLKRQETGHLDDTVDCVILGYYAGRGKRAHFGIGAFLIGVFNPSNDTFQTISKIGTGLRDEEWKSLKTQCDQLTVATKPTNVECPKELFPDTWVTPQIVCSIRADEITLSPLHTAGKTANNLGFALRFPRIMGYREDKGAFDATTISEIQRLFELQFKKK